MRQTKTIKTYATWDELTEIQKEKELEKRRYKHGQFLSEFQLECEVENFKEKLKKLGFKNIKIYYSGFSSQGDGACFEARHNRGTIYHRGHYYHSGTMRCDESEEFLEVCKAIADKFYSRLNKTYESCFEDDFLIEDFLANEMEFLVSEVSE